MCTVISQDTSLENTPTSHAVSLPLLCMQCSDSATMLLCHALAYANGFCLHLLLVHGGVKKRVTINTGPGTRGPGTQGPKDPRTRGPEDRGPEDQGPNDLALLHLAKYDRNATCVNVLSSNVRLIVVSHRVCIVIHTVDALFTPDCAISHYLLAFFICSSLCKPKNSLLYCIQDYKRN